MPRVSSKSFRRLDHDLHFKLWCWARYRHPQKGKRWIRRKYFRQHGNDNWRFKTHDGRFLVRHSDHAIKRHIKVAGTKSPYDGDWVYWATRLGRQPGIQPRVAKLMKTQKGKCGYCQLWFRMGDLTEVHHKDHNHRNNEADNLMLLHRHCHDDIHRQGAHDKHCTVEEPYDGKLSRTVLKSSGEG